MRRHCVNWGKTSRQEVMKSTAIFVIQKKEFEAGPKLKFCNKKNFYRNPNEQKSLIFNEGINYKITTLFHCSV